MAKELNIVLSHLLNGKNVKEIYMDQVNFFKCLSDETRLNIVTLIVENKELCVCDLLKTTIVNREFQDI